MGVRGLSTFFNQNPELSKDHKLHDIPVIIDGNNLIYMLYFTYNLNSIYGGDYDKFASAIKNYFSSYLICNIRPIVIFDGGYDKSDRKLQTTLQRHKKRLTATQHISKYNSCSEKVLPILAFEVFREVLHEIGIAYAQCEYEADDQVTALANHYKCPVISEDSDFYIFDIQHGFIRLSSVEPNVVTKIDNKGQALNFLRCKIYDINDFLSFFPGIEKSVLPLFSTLIGNDFVHINTFDTFFSNIKLPKFKSKRLKVNERQRKIIGLLCWLKHNSLQEAIQLVLRYLKKEQKEYIKNLIEKAVEGYAIKNCNLMSIIEKKDDLEAMLQFNTSLTTPCGQPLPSWFLLRFQISDFPPCFLNVITLHRTFLPCQVEDTTLDSSYTCSLYIRQILYGILLHHNNDLVACTNENCVSSVEEYDRRSGSIKREKVKPIFHNKNMTVLPKINELNNINKKYAETIIKEVLGEDVDFFNLLPADWILLVGSLRYWLRNGKPPLSEEFIYAIIINMIYFSIWKENIKGIVSEVEPHTILCNFSEASVSDLKKTISPPMIEFVDKNLKKYFQKPITNNANPLVLSFIHGFSQLQTCILYLIYLNKLLGSPFASPKIHKSFSGTLIYNLTRDITSRPFPDLFVSELLGRDSTLSYLFFKLKNIILEGIGSDCYVKIDLLKVRSKKKKKGTVKKQKSRLCQEMLSDTFECLNLSEEQGEVDVYL